MPSLDYDEDFDENEYPDEPDYEDDDDGDTVPCSSCGAEVYDDSIRCPICGEYITEGSAIAPLWKWTAIIILILAAIIAGQFVLSIFAQP